MGLKLILKDVEVCKSSIATRKGLGSKTQTQARGPIPRTL